MAGLVAVTEKFAILDEASYLKEIYKSIGVKLDPALFDINGPFLMDSQFEAMKNPNRRIRKRKRPHAENHLTTDCSQISEMLPEIRRVGKELGMFHVAPLKDNNRIARDAAAAVVDEWKEGEGREYEIILSDSDTIDLSERCGWYHNNAPTSTVTINIKNYRNLACYVPPGASFCQGDVNKINEYREKFDLVGMDPPWLNRSAKRTAGYCLSDEAVSSLSLDCLTEEGLCCVWITNRKGLKEEVVSQFSSWDLELISTWHWLKVTSEGEPVYEFHSSHKVPFETLLVACRPRKRSEWRKKIPETFVFASIPMAVHSRKPPLPLMLQAFSISPASSCELFARSLLPNCVSVGFEPLFLQNCKNFCAR